MVELISKSVILKLALGKSGQSAAFSLKSKVAISKFDILKSPRLYKWIPIRR
jgi:hypothetical protein